MLGKLIGGLTGFAWGGPIGAIIGTALGHAADAGTTSGFNIGGAAPSGGQFQQAKFAAMLGQREQVFAISVVVLAAKLAKCDGAVTRAEINAFKQQFRMTPGAEAQVGRLFDQARESSEAAEPYAVQLGKVFADSPGTLEDVLAALFNIARADGPLTKPEEDFLSRTHAAFGLDARGWDRARGGTARFAPSGEADPYGVLGVKRGASDDELRQTWKRLMRENHPDSLASQGAAPEAIARASDRVARINAAWDRIKRERGL